MNPSPALVTLLLLPLLVFTSCRKDKFVMTYSVTFQKEVDSLPAQVDITYDNWSKKYTTIDETGSWQTSLECNYDVYIELSATAVKNIKRIDVKIWGYREPAAANFCEGNGCKVTTRKNIYAD